MSEGNSYQHFAFLYDVLMDEAPYEKWLDFFQKKVSGHLNSAKSLLDIGCGTGTLAIQLAGQGFNVTGVDLSDEMLAVSASKLAETDQRITFVQQDMRQLQLGQTFPIATAFCDVINYLESFEDVKETFSSVYDHLDDGGLFLFDVHSVYKMDHIFQGASFCSADPELSYIWECFEGAHEHSIEHELSFFVQEDNGFYRRYDETHKQRTFDKADYVLALEDAGFKLISVEGDFEEGAPHEHAERLFFTAIKKK
jgi:cyclopropane fatty-acyl-phospholipid synthase-like methyltransferase